MAGSGWYGTGFKSLSMTLGLQGPAPALLPATQALGGTLANFIRLDETDPHHLEPEEIDGVIAASGHPCEWRRGVLCPCSRPDTNLPAVGCDNCRGLGWYHPPELRQQGVKVLVGGRTVQDMAQRDAGYARDGRVSLTFQTACFPARGDLVLPEGEVHVVQEALVRARREVDPGHLLLPTEDHDIWPPDIRPAVDRLVYPDVLGIEALSWQANGRAVLATEGLDFTCTAGVITWRPLRGPQAGERFTVRYRAPGAYLIGSDVTPRMEGGIRLPDRVTAKRLDRLGDPDLRDGT